MNSTVPAPRSRRPARRRPHRAPSPRASPADDGRRRFLDHLLPPTLRRAVALAEVDRVAVRVGEDLDLDVRPSSISLEHQRAVAERAQRLSPGAGDRLRDLAAIAHQPHAAPAAAGHRLTSNGSRAPRPPARGVRRPALPPDSLARTARLRQACVAWRVPCRHRRDRRRRRAMNTRFASRQACANARSR